MNPKSVVEVILLHHVAMVVSKQQRYVIETLPNSINIDRKDASAAHSETKRSLSSPKARRTQDKQNPASSVNVCISVRLGSGYRAEEDEASLLLIGGHSPNAYLLRYP